MRLILSVRHELMLLKLMKGIAVVAVSHGDTTLAKGGLAKMKAEERRSRYNQRVPHQHAVPVPKREDQQQQNAS